MTENCRHSRTPGTAHGIATGHIPLLKWLEAKWKPSKWLQKGFVGLAQGSVKLICYVLSFFSSKEALGLQTSRTLSRCRWAPTFCCTFTTTRKLAVKAKGWSKAAESPFAPWCRRGCRTQPLRTPARPHAKTPCRGDTGDA